MIRTNVSFYEEQYERIKRECYENGESLSAFLREVLDVYWKEDSTSTKSSVSSSTNKSIPKKKKIIKTVTDVKEVINFKTNLCKHGMMPGLCKHGCK